MQRTQPPVAIIGMALRFPGSPDVGSYWRNLLAGVESVRRFSTAELLAAGESAKAVSSPNYVPARGVIDDADCFDSAFFGFTEKEARLTDPQQRLLLELTWRALEDAGYPPGPEPRVGLFAGARNNGFAEMVRRHGQVPRDRVSELHLKIGSDPGFIATHVSYCFNLRGPSLTIQTACSSSLAAVHLACRALAAGDCDIALAGGVSVELPLGHGYLWEEGLIDSADGHCRAFDDAATGIVGGDGAGLVALRPLDDALQARDAIHAVIRGTAMNNDGNDKLGFSAPSVRGQIDLMRAGLRSGGIRPASVGYVEAHGTGTRLGDPIELRALHEVFCAGRDQPCWIGSVKSNIGHLDAAAGVAGLIKAALVVENGQIPASLHLNRPNRTFDWNRSLLRPARATFPWPSDGPRRAAVSSLGMGGTNAFAVLEEPPHLPADAGEPRWYAMPLSARSPAALEISSAALAAILRDTPSVSVRDVAYTLDVGRRRFECRRAVVCRSATEGAAALRAAAQPPAKGAPVRRCVLLMPGQAVHVRGAGAMLYRSHPAFAAALDEVCELVLKQGGWDPRAILCAATPADGGDLETDRAQVCLFAFQYSLATAAAQYGIRPDAVVAHSAGEVAAATVAGVLSLRDAAALSVERGRACHRLCPTGAMVAVAADVGTAAELAAKFACVVSAVNAPEQCVVSGTAEAIAKLEEHLRTNRVPHSLLRTTRAFHSPLMEPAAEALGGVLNVLDLHRPQIPFLSSLTGSEAGEAVATAGYWQRQLVQPVRFHMALTAAGGPGTAYLDAGPGQVLHRLAVAQLRRSGEASLATALHVPEPGRDEDECLVRAMARLWTAGAPVRWDGQHGGAWRARLPGHPLSPSRYPVPVPARQEAAVPVPARQEAAEPVPAARQAPHAAQLAAEMTADCAPHDVNDATMLVAAIFEEVIGGPVQLDESFFEIGGDSLMAVQAAARISDAFGVEFGVTDLFSNPSARQMAGRLSQVAS